MPGRSTPLVRAMYARRKAAGLCIRCGNVPWQGPGKCPGCNAAVRARAASRKALGLCCDCKEPAAPGRSRCPAHLAADAALRRRLRAARQAG